MLCFVQSCLLLGLYALRLITSLWLAAGYMLLLGSLSLWLAVAAGVAFRRARVWLGFVVALFSIPGLLYMLGSLLSILN